jgi:hypothetical protein
MMDCLEGCAPVATCPLELMPFPMFVDMLQRKKLSAPGSDGVSYVFWINAPESFHLVLYSLYTHLMDFGHLPPAFNHALMVFIPKAIDDDDDDEDLTAIRRSAKKVRPISLSKCVGKRVCSAVCHSLTPFVAQVTHPAQRGGVAGKQIVDNVLDIEAAAVRYARVFYPDMDSPCIILHDFQIAFPSI